MFTYMCVCVYIYIYPTPTPNFWVPGNNLVSNDAGNHLVSIDIKSSSLETTCVYK